MRDQIEYYRQYRAIPMTAAVKKTITLNHITLLKLDVKNHLSKKYRTEKRQESDQGQQVSTTSVAHALASENLATT